MTLTFNDDLDVEGNETVVLTLDNSQAALVTLGTITTHTFTITDNDIPPTPTPGPGCYPLEPGTVICTTD